MPRVKLPYRTGVLLLGFLLVTNLPAAETALDKDKVLALIHQLEDTERASRDQAEAALRQLGAPVLSLLPEIDTNTAGELKQRLLRIRNHLERLQVTESAQSSRVSLQGTMSISEVFAKLEQQTGNTIMDYRARLNQTENDTEITVDLDDEPFWSALDQILDEAGLSVYSFVGEPRKLAVVAAPDGAADRHEAGAYHGLFRIEPTTIVSERNLRNPTADILRMSIEIIWEPRVLPILIRHDLEDIKIETDTGETLSVSSTGTIQQPVQPGVAAIDMRLPLELPSRDAQKIASLQGKFTALVPGGDVEFEFTDLTSRNVQQRKGGLTVILDQVRRNGGVQQIFIRMRFDQANESLQSHLDWVENNKIQLLDPQGQPADEPNYEQYLERDSEIGYAYIYPVDAENLKGWKLIYTTPAGIAEFPVDYEIRDIMLP